MASHGSCVITSVTNPASALDLPRVTAILAHPTLSTSKPLLVRAPGRVNLLGEHVDYSGYGVLPMAVTASVLIRIKEVPTPPNEAPTITVSNTDAKFETSVHPADPSADLDLSAFHWSYYFMCGYKGTFDAITSPPTAFSSLEIVVSGNIPSGAGLSSSSAFVVASTLATAGFYGEPMTRTDLAKAAIEGELYCGTLSGGMDQVRRASEARTTLINLNKRAIREPIAQNERLTSSFLFVHSVFVAGRQHPLHSQRSALHPVRSLAHVRPCPVAA